MADDTAQAVTCLDLNVSGGALDGKNVAGQIDAALKVLTPLLPENQVTLLQRQAEIAREHHTDLGPITKRAHPLRELRGSSPIYTTLSFHLFQDFLALTAPPLVYLAQQAALLRFLGYGDQQSSTIAKFAHLIIKSQISVTTALNVAIPSALTKSDVESAIAALRGIDTTGDKDHLSLRKNEFAAILNVLADFVDSSERAEAEKQKTKKRKPKPRPTFNQFVTSRPRPPDRKRGKTRATNSWRFPTDPAKPPDDESDDLEPTLTGDDEADDAAEERSLKTLQQHGHRLRLNRLYAERSGEAAAEPECRKALQLLLEYAAKDPPSSAARLGWQLTSTSGRHFDKIVRAIGGIEDEHDDGDLLAIERNGNEFTFTIRHMIASRLPEVPASVGIEPVADEFQLNVVLPPTSDLDSAWEFLRQCSSKADIDQLLVAKDTIRNYIRDNGVDRFTETRARGAIVQRVFNRTLDFPLTQLLFTETLDVSAASLHYPCWTQAELQETFASAVTSLYGDLLPPQPELFDQQQRIGADLAGIPIDILTPLARWSGDRLRQANASKGRADWIKRHNNLADAAIHRLVVGAAHRNTEDIQQIRRTDISFNAGIVIFRDKPADSSIYRRLAVIPADEIALIEHYLANLEAVEGYGRKTIPTVAMEAIEQALNGSGPLFFRIEGDAIAPIKTRELFKDYFPPSVKPNQQRHLQGTHLRGYGASPLLAEVHLGHHFGGPVFGDAGLLSPVDVATHMRPHLDRFMREAGYTIPGKLRSTKQTNVFTADEICRLEQEEKRADRALLRRQLKDTLDALPSREQINTQINTAIKSVVDNYRSTNPPKGVSIDRTASLKIRNALIGNLGNDMTAIYRACRRLRKRLRELSVDRSWHIELPPAIAWEIRPPLPITRANMVAFDQQAIFRDRLIQYCSDIPNPDLYTSARCALLLWGNCPYWQETEEWLAAAKDTPTRQGEDYLIIQLSEAAGGRTLTGTALVFVAAWVKSGAKLTSTPLSQILGERLDATTLEATARYAKIIEYPRAFVDVLNGELPHAELPAARIHDFLSNLTGCNGNIPETDRPDNDTQPAAKATPPDDLAQLFKRLRQRIENPPKGMPGQRPALRSVKQWQSGRDLPPIIDVLRGWAIHLLGPTSNLQSGGELLNNTVSGYLLDVWVPLIKAFPDGDLYDVDLDEATELLEEALSDSDTKRREEIERLNRFFREMNPDYPIPDIRLTQEEGSAPPPLYPRLITCNEYHTTTQTLTEWATAPELDAALSPAVKQIASAAEGYYQAGMRRNELLGIKNKDIISDDQRDWLVIRPHQNRSLKTAASHRHLELTRPLVTPAGRPSESFFDALELPEHHHAATTALSMSLRYATGSPSTRVHDFRHSKASRGIAEAINQDDPLERLRSLATLTAELGHASLRTTLHYYAHLTHFALAWIQRGKELDVPNTLLSALFSESPENIRQRKRRARKGNPLGAQYAKSFPRREKLQIENIPPPPPVPDLLMKASGQTLPLATTLRWLLKFARGASATDGCYGLLISIKQLRDFLVSLDKIQKQIGWEAVEAEVLAAEMTWLTDGEATRNPARKHHKRFPEGWLDAALQLIDKNNAHHIPAKLASHCMAIQWRRRAGVYINLGSDQPDALRAGFKALGIDISFLQHDENAGDWQLIPPVAVTEKHGNNLLKLMALALLLHSDYSPQG